MGEIDEAFIQAAEQRPKPTITEAEGIPVINLSPLISIDHLSSTNLTEEAIAVISQVGDACEKWGFFQVVNHGIPMDKLHHIDRVARKFFSLPMEEKRKVLKDEENPMGYHDTELTRNVRDWKQVFDFTTKDDETPIPVSPDDLHAAKPVVNRWPDNPPEFR